MRFLHFFQILTFSVNGKVKGRRMTQNDKKLSVALYISGSIHQIMMIFDTQV